MKAYESQRVGSLSPARAFHFPCKRSILLLNKFTLAIGIAVTLCAVSGCASLAPRSLVFTTTSGTLSFTKVGCTLKDFKYTDMSGKGAAFPYFKLLSLDAAGNTMDEFSISCQAALPSRSSNCIHMIVTKNDFMTYGGPGCPNLNSFQLLSMR